MKSSLAGLTLIFGVLAVSAHAAGEGSPIENTSSVSVDPKQFRVSLSVSPLAELLFQMGYVFTDGRTTAKSLQQLQSMFVAHGATEVYARINTKRARGKHPLNRSMAKALDRARIAAKLKLPFNPELGLFGEYADVRGQMAPDFSEYPEIKLPAGWYELSIDQMEDAIRSYTRIAAGEILATGVKVNIWDIGNEINFGIAGVAAGPAPGFAPAEVKDWYIPPDNIDPEIGKKNLLDLVTMPDEECIAWCRKHLWPHVGRILVAAAEGIRQVDHDARFSTHIAFSSPEFSVAFFRAMKDGGFECDEIGISFYPSNRADGLKMFKDVVRRLVAEFGKPVFVAEYAYNAALMTTGPFRDWNHSYPGYPMSEDGQAAMLADITSWGLPNGLSGIRPWAPEGVLDLWRPLALFDLPDVTMKAVARKAIDSMSYGLAHPDPAALKE